MELPTAVTGKIAALFLPSVSGIMSHLVRFCRVSYQVHRQMRRTRCISDPFSYQVHGKMEHTWYDFVVFFTWCTEKHGIPGMISRPNCGRWGWTRGHLPRFSTLFLPGMREIMAYLVRFHGQTVAGGDSGECTCQGSLLFSYQVHRETWHTWYDFTAKL